uniref:Uncharacterized protein n=1 Tax=Periophthalmus magnuspinnatus TaxID=409849 RepID=A0A3B4B3U8_9GOBI
MTPPGTPPGTSALALGARLEEKRKSIEAQKRRIEAIFAKHRQRLGKTAFLQLQREPITLFLIPPSSPGCDWTLVV